MTKRQCVQVQQGQQGASFLSTIISLAVLGYGIFVGMQYVPIKMESSTIDSILRTLQEGHVATPAASVHEVESRISNLLNLNIKDDLKDAFDVSQNGGDFIVRAYHERDLNLLFETRAIVFDETVTLK